MNSKIFKTKNGLELVVKDRKHAVIFEIKTDAENQYNLSFNFTSRDFEKLLKYIELIANKSWKNLTPREANSFGADYFEYYDRKLDNNGYLTIKPNTLIIERPSLESKRLYQFNKKKMESFIYDFREILKE